MSTPDCAICLDQLYGNDQEVAVVTTCGHSFHSACIFQAHARDQRCPTCRGPIPDRGSIARITFQGDQEPENDQDDNVFSESVVDDDSVENEDSDDEDRPSDQERAYNNLSVAFAYDALHLRRVQEEKDKVSRKLSQKKRKIKDLEARIRLLEMQSSSTRGNGRSQPTNTAPRPARLSSLTYDDFARLYRI